MHEIRLALFRLGYVLFRSDLSFVELLLAVCYLGWGLVLLLSPDVFARSRAYNPLEENAPQWAWAWFFLATGAVMVVGLLAARPRWRIVGGVTGVGLWVYVAVAFASYGITTGMVVYAAFALTSFLTVIRHFALLRNRGKSSGEAHANLS